ncbi:MAG: diguanylate cyclase [Saccharospirillaceae bacterium]|nr:diguanylate cyclase [Saccharospirillaceae bacterium]
MQTINTPNQKGFNRKITHINQYPFCVLTINITDNHLVGLDFTDFSEMKVVGTFESPDKEFLRIGFRHYDPTYSKLGSGDSMKLNQIEVKSESIVDSFTVDLTRLTVPAWWVAGHKKEDVNDIVELTNITIIEISTGTSPSIGDYKLRIKHFVLEKEIISLSKVYEYLLISWAWFLMLLMCCVVCILMFRLKEKNRNEKILIEINAALSLEKIELEANSQTDALTGALNRFGLQKQLVHIVKEQQFPCVIIIVDIDHFKGINDEFGH